MKYLLLTLFIGVSLSLFSQTMDEVKMSKCYYGEGLSSNLEEATQMALRDLVTQLKASITVQSNLHQTDDETLFNSTIDIKSSVFLNGVNKIIEEVGKNKNKQFRVLQYILIDSLNKEKAYKLYKYMGYISQGDKYLALLDISNALKHYYWSFMLTANDWKISSTRTLDDKDYNVNLFKNKIDSVLSNISFKIEQVSYSGYNVIPFYESQPLSNLSYMIMKDNSWERVLNNYVQFDNSVPDEIVFKIDFETFEGLVKDEETRYILAHMNKTTLNSLKRVKVTNNKNITKNNMVIGSHGTIYVTTNSHVGIVTMNGKIWGETPILMKSSTGLTSLSIQDKITGEVKHVTIPVQTGTISYLRIKF